MARKRVSAPAAEKPKASETSAGRAKSRGKKGRKPLSERQKILRARKALTERAKMLGKGLRRDGKKQTYMKYSGREGGNIGSSAQKAAAKAAGAKRTGKGLLKRRATTAQTPAGKAWAAAVKGQNGQALRDHDALRKYIRNNPGKGKGDWLRMRKERAKKRAAKGSKGGGTRRKAA